MVMLLEDNVCTRLVIPITTKTRSLPSPFPVDGRIRNVSTISLTNYRYLCSSAYSPRVMTLHSVTFFFSSSSWCVLCSSTRGREREGDEDCPHLIPDTNSLHGAKTNHHQDGSGREMVAKMNHCAAVAAEAAPPSGRRRGKRRVVN